MDVLHDDGFLELSEDVENTIITEVAKLTGRSDDWMRRYMMAATAIIAEMDHQDRKWGAGNPQSVPGFLIVLENELNEAKHGWTKNIRGRDSCMSEIVQVAAVAIQALMRYGTEGCPRSTNDEIVA